MRDIKFRCWNNVKKRWENDHEEMWLTLEGDACYMTTTGGYEGHDYLKRIAVVVCQYTGLKDKNGKEIYEGDIVVFDLGGNHNANPVEMKWGIAGFKYSSMFEFGHQCEIIGNVYENPDLLSKAQNAQASVATDDESKEEDDKQK